MCFKPQCLRLILDPDNSKTFECTLSYLMSVKIKCEIDLLGCRQVFLRDRCHPKFFFSILAHLSNPRCVISVKSNNILRNHVRWEGLRSSAEA